MGMNMAHCSERFAIDEPANVIVRFGPDDRLTGVLSGAHGTGPTLLLPSAGLQPRAGPFRLHVELAERLAASGIRSFRYDIPGVGEAPRLPGCDAAGATRAAMDVLEARHGCSTFAVGGICSAADAGWEVANLDPRVSALLLLDGICFAGPWYTWARMTGLLRRLPGEWRSLAHKLQSRMREDAGPDPADFRSWPDRARARREFEQMVQRDVRLLFIFSGGYGEQFLHPRQFGWTFGPLVRDPRVVMHYWPEADHTYFGRIQRDRLITTVDQWMAALAAETGP